MSRKTSKADLWRSYGLERPSNVRYKANERKSIYWVLVSRFCRIRDFRKYGTCISCGKKVEWWQDLQGGHYAPAAGCGVSLLFDPMNVNGECPRCNGTDEGHLIGYRRNLVVRYGVREVENIEARYLHHQKNPGEEKEWPQDVYHRYIEELIELMIKEDMLTLEGPLFTFRLM